MSWRLRRTRSAERRRGGARCALVAALSVTLVALPVAASARESSRFSFAVIGDALGASPGSEATAQKMIDAIGRDPRIAFVVYDGNLKSASESCNDALYERRQALLDASRPALIFVPGQQDWVTCASAGHGDYDPAERLDLLRQTIFSDSSSLGQNPLPLTRESEVPRFHPYRENVRWQVGDTVFIALNLPDGNNHYLNAGGRNGEFEDRVIANGFWLEHAGEYAKRHKARAVVVFVQGNPWAMVGRERRERFGWLRFRHRPRDGYVEFRHSLAKLARTFGGPVLIFHQDDTKLARGFEIDQPLRNEKGVTIANVTRIAVALHDPAKQWLHVDADMGRRPPLRIGVRDVPKHLPPLPQPMPSLVPLVPRDGAAPLLPDMPEISSMPDVTEVPSAPAYSPLPPPFQTAPGEFAPPASGAASTPPQPPQWQPPPAPPPGAGAVYRN